MRVLLNVVYRFDGLNFVRWIWISKIDSSLLVSRQQKRNDEMQIAVTSYCWRIEPLINIVLVRKKLKFLFDILKSSLKVYKITKKNNFLVLKKFLIFFLFSRMPFTNNVLVAKTTSALSLWCTFLWKSAVHHKRLLRKMTYFPL